MSPVQSAHSHASSPDSQLLDLVGFPLLTLPCKMDQNPAQIVSDTLLLDVFVFRHGAYMLPISQISCQLISLTGVCVMHMQDHNKDAIIVVALIDIF